MCRALGYDLNTVEFAVEDGIPYAIDFMNPAPDAEATSVGQENFEWVVNAVAEMAVKKALSDENPARELRWAAFLAGEGPVAVARGEAFGSEANSGLMRGQRASSPGPDSRERSPWYKLQTSGLIQGSDCYTV